MPIISVLTNATGKDTSALKRDLAKWWADATGLDVNYQMVHVKQGEVRL